MFWTRLDFKFRDRLVKEGRERESEVRSFTEDPRVMIYTIPNCSQGNEEEAAIFLNASKEFMDRFRNIGRTFDMLSTGWTAEDIMFLFWKKSFIELILAVHKNEILPHDS